MKNLERFEMKMKWWEDILLALGFVLGGSYVVVIVFL